MVLLFFFFSHSSMYVQIRTKPWWVYFWKKKKKNIKNKPFDRDSMLLNSTTKYMVNDSHILCSFSLSIIYFFLSIVEIQLMVFFTLFTIQHWFLNQFTFTELIILINFGFLCLFFFCSFSTISIENECKELCDRFQWFRYQK